VLPYKNYLIGDNNDNPAWNCDLRVTAFRGSGLLADLYLKFTAQSILWQFTLAPVCAILLL